MKPGTSLMAIVCVAVLWYEADLSLWWLPAIGIAAWLLNSLPTIREIVTVSEQMRSQIYSEFQRQVEERTRREIEEAKRRSEASGKGNPRSRRLVN